MPDVYQDALDRYFWLYEETDEAAEAAFMTTEEIVQHLLLNGIRDNPRAMSMAVGAALRKMGRQRKRTRAQGPLRRGYTGIAPKVKEEP